MAISQRETEPRKKKAGRRSAKQVRPKANRNSSAGSGGAGGGGSGIVSGDLMSEARRRYLNYALSVITARAIPDVRDGLKPVQRRILYTMYNDLHLYHDARHRKSAKVVGDVIGKYHPHGDTAVYDAMVRMAQDFAMRARLVDGQGNFGSIDGDSAAAYRYTEARLSRIASELLSEIKQETVAFRPTFDSTGEEPVVLPARFPNVLVNGATGIAVGMATSIPPHNLGEVIRASLALIDDPDLSVQKLIKHVKGPDFPTGGQLVATKEEIIKTYESGRGSFKLRGTWKIISGEKGATKIAIQSVPYSVEKVNIVEEIGQIIISKKIPGLVGIQDLSTNDVHVELELAANSSVNPELVMAYLFKRTRLQVTVKVDFTCLVPLGGDEQQTGPSRLDLAQVLRHFLDFRLLTIRKRFEYELRQLEQRIHILEGFEKIFDDLDRAIRIIRKSDGKRDAAIKLMNAFDLDEMQADAVLETKLYKLARLEIERIRAELKEKRKRAAEIRKILASKQKLWAVVRDELQELMEAYQDRRRTIIDSDDLTEEFTVDSFIVEEDAYVLVTRDGWIKRQRALNLETTRMREGDAALAVIAGTTKERVILFSNKGSAYVQRINDVIPSSGHGTPVQQAFKFKDGERVIAGTGTDPRMMPEFAHEKPDLGEEYEEPYPHFIAVTKQGMALRFALWPHSDASTSRGRLFGRLKGDDEFVSVFKVYSEDDVCVVTRKGRLLRTNALEVNLLAGPGRGVTLIKLEPEDEVVAAFPSDWTVTLEKNSGGSQSVKGNSYEASARAGKGRQLFKRGRVEKVIFPLPEVPPLTADSDSSTDTN